jgi:ABC-type bacteriocin/lantibiotic exporter with double-glycine peptidase domain
MLRLYKAIWRRTAQRQIVLIMLSLMVAALAAVPLDYQKKIINGLSQGVDFSELFRLGAEMIAVILLSLALKWMLNYRSGLAGEWAIKLLRTQVCEKASSFEKDGERKLEEGTLANMISSESETVGKFVGDAVAEPVLQIGTLISVVGYITVTQPVLGLLLLLVVAPQIVILVLTQAKINALVAERVLVLRRSINKITQRDIAEAQQTVLEDFDRIYEARRKIFIWKLSTKFALSAINGFGLVAVLIVGGWMVIEGRSDVGIVVAATIGLGRIEQPWRLLTAFYRNLNAIKVQFELMRSLFIEPQEEDNRQWTTKETH